jgi:hypothetical protein
LQGINQIVLGPLVVELLGQVRIQLEVHATLLDGLNYLVTGGASEQEKHDVVLR